MGEAKYRKANDQSFGKIKQACKLRGLIISCPLKIIGSTMIGSGSIDAQDLRFSLFFGTGFHGLPRKGYIFQVRQTSSTLRARGS